MLKRTGAVALAAAGLMMLGSPAFATPATDVDLGTEFDWDEWGYGELYDDVNVDADSDQNDQMGLVNFADDSDLLSNLNLCEIEVNVIAIPILSQNDSSACINTDNDGNSSDDDGHSDDEDDYGDDDD